MIPIRKKHPPKSLSHYHRDANASFGNMPTATRDELRQSLLEEQGEICCYCMSRISSSESRIEHWQCQSEFPDRQLDYANMMLACHGSENAAPAEQHCDVKKRTSPLTFNPSDPNHAQRLKIRYLSNGRIESEDNEFSRQLATTLNLNVAMLRANRKAVYDATIQAVNKKTVSDLLAKYQSTHGRKEPFCGVALYHLEKWRRKRS